MRLTRRDALAALGAAGVAGGAAHLARDAGDGGRPLGERERATLVAAAEVLYPSEVAGVAAFVERYLQGLGEDRPDRASGIAEAATFLDEYAESWHGTGFAALDRMRRDEVLRRMDADTASPDPAGSAVERVRHHVVDELLLALYATPTGGNLVGIENPPGHPGGLASYQREGGR